MKRNIYEFAKYVASHTPITYGEARLLVPVCDMLGILKEEVVEDLKINGGDWFRLHREYLLGGGR